MLKHAKVGLNSTLVAGNKDPHPKVNEGLLSNFGNFQPYIRP